MMVAVNPTDLLIARQVSFERHTRTTRNTANDFSDSWIPPVPAPGHHLTKPPPTPSASHPSIPPPLTLHFNRVIVSALINSFAFAIAVSG